MINKLIEYLRQWDFESDFSREYNDKFNIDIKTQIPHWKKLKKIPIKHINRIKFMINNVIPIKYNNIFFDLIKKYGTIENLESKYSIYFKTKRNRRNRAAQLVFFKEIESGKIKNLTRVFLKKLHEFNANYKGNNITNN